MRLIRLLARCGDDHVTALFLMPDGSKTVLVVNLATASVVASLN